MKKIVEILELQTRKKSACTKAVAWYFPIFVFSD